MVHPKTIFAHLILPLVIVACGPPEKEFKREMASIAIGSNQHFAIVLPEVHSKGQTWQFHSSDEAILVTYNGSSWHGDAVGAKFHFKSIRTGTCLLNFSLHEYNKTTDSCHYVVKISD
jgi:hypothetical protein